MVLRKSLAALRPGHSNPDCSLNRVPVFPHTLAACSPLAWPLSSCLPLVVGPRGYALGNEAKNLQSRMMNLHDRPSLVLCASATSGRSASGRRFNDFLLKAYQCTRPRPPHHPPWPLAGLAIRSLTGCS
jgi:hypothetical protein